MTDQLKPIFSWRSAICESGLAPATRHVALTLSLYMNERGGSAHPGPTRLARETGLHVSTVKEKLTELEAKGWLRCVQRGGIKGERKTANEYEAAIPPTPLPIALHHPSPETTGSSEAGDRSSSPEAPVAQGDPISPENSPLSRQRRRTALPKPFVVTDEMRSWAEENCATVDVDPETIEFVTYWRGDGGVKADWTETWKNHLVKKENWNRRRSA